MSKSSPRVKTIKTGPQSDLAFLRVSDDFATMSSSKPKNFVTTDLGGVSIGGPLNYQGLPNQMTFAGLLTFPFFPLMFLPIGPTMVPSLVIPRLAANFAVLSASLTSLTV